MAFQIKVPLALAVKLRKHSAAQGYASVDEFCERLLIDAIEKFEKKTRPAAVWPAETETRSTTINERRK